MLMKRFVLALPCLVAVMTSSAVAEDVIESGQWKVTTNTIMNGAATPPQVKAKCLTPEQTGDIGKTFGPEIGTVNSNCERSEYDASGRKLKWHLQCKGQIDMDVSGSFDFDSPQHYTATVTARGWMAGQLMSDVKTQLEGERVGPCQP
jgi:Protein of unknown function (DUF3617)